MVGDMDILYNNLGQEMLDSLVDGHGGLRALANRLGMNEKTLGAYRRGKRKPLTAERVTLKEKAKIPLLSWEKQPTCECRSKRLAA